ncbi:MAG: hypothetical protein KAG66_11610 [Methylococcales bacterium]|nr:hypothetical protein [Methylococcales bacterium]
MKVKATKEEIGVLYDTLGLPMYEGKGRAVFWLPDKTGNRVFKTMQIGGKRERKMLNDFPTSFQGRYMRPFPIDPEDKRHRRKVELDWLYDDFLNEWVL